MSEVVSMLLELDRTRRSGVVRAERGRDKKQVIACNGLLAAAESNQPDEHLANILLNLQLLSKNEFSAAAGLIRSGKPADEAVLSSAKIDYSTIQTGAREQAIRILASIVAWDACSLHFYAGEDLVRRKIHLQLSIVDILLLAVRRAAFFFERRPAGFNISTGVVAPNVSPGENHMRLPLDDAESFTYSLIAAPTRIQDLLPLLPTKTAKPEELLLRLLYLGLIRLESPAPKIPTSTEPLDSIETHVDDLLRNAEAANAYEILGLSTDADNEEIKAAYHALVKKYHPDKFESEEFNQELRRKIEALFAHITGAYADLGSPETRAAYDEARHKRESRVDAALQTRASGDVERERMAETLFRAGQAARLQADFEKAVRFFKECIWLCPNTAPYHHYLGVAQTEIPKFRKDAEQHLLKAIEISKVAPETHLALGKLYLKVNLPRRAEQQFHEVLRWDPDNPEATTLLQTLAK
jgi:molecular chaperone DnaJ